jgi:hypothetical protein
MGDNIVDFHTKKQRQEEAAAKEAGQKKLPQEIQDGLKDLSGKADELADLIDKTITKFAEDNEARMDISVPLEALARNMGQISADLDAQVLPEVLEEHRNMRFSLSHEVNEAVQKFSESYDENTPVYSQDLYIGLIYTLVSYIQQHRIWGQMMEHEKTKKGESEDE